MKPLNFKIQASEIVLEDYMEVPGSDLEFIIDTGKKFSLETVRSDWECIDTYNMFFIGTPENLFKFLHAIVFRYEIEVE